MDKFSIIKDSEDIYYHINFNNAVYIPYIRIDLSNLYDELSMEKWFKNLTKLQKSVMMILVYQIGKKAFDRLYNTKNALNENNIQMAVQYLQESTIDAIITPSILHNLLNLLCIEQNTERRENLCGK